MEEKEQEAHLKNQSEAPAINPEDVERLVDSLQIRQEEEIKDLQDELKNVANTCDNRNCDEYVYA